MMRHLLFGRVQGAVQCQVSHHGFDSFQGLQLTFGFGFCPGAKRS
jgi:hypothetical protein